MGGGDGGEDGEDSGEGVVVVTVVDVVRGGGRFGARWYLAGERLILRVKCNSQSQRNI